MISQSATCTCPAFNALFTLKFKKSSPNIYDIRRSNFKGKIIEGMNFYGCLNEMIDTSFLQTVHVMDDLVKPISLFSTSQGSSKRTELDRLMVLRRLTTSSKLPTSAA